MSNIEANKESALKIIQAISDQEWSYVKTVYAEDASIWVAGSTPISGSHTRAFIDQLDKGNDGKYPNGFKLVCHSMIADGNRVAAECESMADHVSGKYYNNHYHLLFVFDEDGLVCEYKEYMDTAHVEDVFFGQ